MSEKEINKLIRKITIIVICLIVFIWGLFNLNTLGDIFGNIERILRPFLIGILLALILGAPVKFLEKKITNKGLSIGISVVFIILMCVMVVAIVIPELINIGKMIVENSPLYNQKITEFVNNMQTTFPNINITGIAEQISNNLKDFGSTLTEQLPQILSNSITAITTTVLGIVNFCMGIAFAVMILVDGEKIKVAMKKIMHTFIGEKFAKKVIRALNIFRESFSNFIVAQCTNSLVVGVLCVIIGLIAGVPNAVQAGILVGITSIIPMFGALIGIILSLIIIVVVSPIKALIFLVISIIVWQLGENVFKPILVGRKLGMPGILQFLGVIIGGAMFGFLGVLLGIPVMNTIYVLIEDRIKDTKVD